MGKPEPIRVMIVDDHRVVRAGLRFSLLAFDDLEVAAEVESGKEALAACRRLDDSNALPDVILMDMVMPEMDGVTAIRALVEEHRDVRILVLTGFDTGALIRQALDAGATGYILKNVSIDELADAIRAVCTGRLTLAPEAMKALAQGSIA